MFDYYYAKQAAAIFDSRESDFKMERGIGLMDGVDIRINLDPAEDGIKLKHKNGLERMDKQMAIIGTNGKHRGVSRKEAMRFITLMTKCGSMPIGEDYIAFYNKSNMFYLDGTTYYVGSLLVMKMSDSPSMQPLSKGELQEVLGMIQGRTAELRAGAECFSALEM